MLAAGDIEQLFYPDSKLQIKEIQCIKQKTNNTRRIVYVANVINKIKLKDHTTPNGDEYFSGEKV